MKFCEKCGNKLEEGVLFCNKCGAKVEKKEKKAEKKEEVVPSQPVRLMPVMPQKKGRGLSIFLTITSIILFATTITFLVLWLVKSPSCGSSNGGGSGKGGKERTVEYLFDQYVKAYTQADLDAVKDIFPPFYIEYAKTYMTKERLETALENAKDRYGKDFNITYKIEGKTKMTASELESLNDKMANYYNAKEKAEECYKLEGTITFKGSSDIDTDPIDSSRYCKYNGVWYLVEG